MFKILIIEDEKAMSDLITLKFQVEGYDVVQAFTLSEAKEKIIPGAGFNAILTDYLLPDGSLIDFLTVLRTSSEFAKIPIVVMTNYVEDLNIDQLKSLGVVDIFVKYQVVPAQMVEKINGVISDHV